MAEDEIVGKLKWGLGQAKKCVDEPLVIFVLVKIRKLLEDNRFKKRYSALKFYCDWPLHRKLDREGAKIFLSKVEKIILTWKVNKNAEEKAKNLLSFAEFRKELKGLLSEEGLPTDLVKNPTLLFEFFRSYASAIQDTPLEISDKRHIRKLTLQAMRTDIKATPRRVPLRFLIEMDDPNTPPAVLKAVLIFKGS